MVLYAVYQLRGVLKAASYGQGLGFNSEVLSGHVTVYVSGAVAGCQYHRSHECALLSGMRGVDAYYPVALQYETGHQGLKMDLTAAVYYGVADVLDYARQAVGAYVRVGIGQD